MKAAAKKKLSAKGKAKKVAAIFLKGNSTGHKKGQPLW